MQADEIIRKVSGILNDAGFITWDYNDLLDYMNSACLLVVSFRPDASVAIGPVDLVDGTLQSLPAGGHRIVDVFHNGPLNAPGIALWKTEREIKNRAEPAWLSEAPSSTIYEVILDDHFPDQFWVSPPAIEGAQITIGYTVAPTPVANPEDTFPLLAKYEPAVMEWILYLAFSRDSEETPNQVRAETHKATCLTMLGVKTQADKASSPSVRKRGTE